jgi:hypothetical protein
MGGVSGSVFWLIKEKEDERSTSARAANGFGYLLSNNQNRLRARMNLFFF